MTEKPCVVIPGDDPPMIAGTPHLERLAERADVRMFRDRPQTDEEKIARAAGATVLLNSRGSVAWPGSVLRQLPELRMISACGIGTDSLDVRTAGELGITVCNVPGRTATVVAEHAFTLMLSISRRVAWMTQAVRDGRWPFILTTSQVGKTLGVIGTGNIGCEMIRMARAFGMDVVAWSFNPDESKAERFGFRYDTLEAVLRTADVVSLHVKLTEQSRRLIGADQLSMMKPGALLVNTARGLVIDTPALVEALNTGHLGGAALDVFEQEPVPHDAPILQCEHVILTPHAADQTPEGIDLLTSGCVDNVLAFLDGSPQNVVTA